MTDPLVVNPEVELPQLDISNNYTTDCTIEYSTGIQCHKLFQFIVRLFILRYFCIQILPDGFFQAVWFLVSKQAFWAHVTHSFVHMYSFFWFCLILGNFTCLAVVFNLRRRLGYHLFHTYIPSALIVVMSWISFWIKPEAIPARVTLGVTSLLTLGKYMKNNSLHLTLYWTGSTII